MLRRCKSQLYVTLLRIFTVLRTFIFILFTVLWFIAHCYIGITFIWINIWFIDMLLSFSCKPFQFSIFLNFYITYSPYLFPCCQCWALRDGKRSSRSSYSRSPSRLIFLKRETNWEIRVDSRCNKKEGMNLCNVKLSTRELDVSNGRNLPCRVISACFWQCWLKLLFVSRPEV